MIAFIEGKIAAVSRDTVVLDHQGMGFEIYYPHTDKVKAGDEIRIYTSLSVSENDMRLYGFADQQEKNMYIRLTSVKGLGPKTAITILSRASYNDLVNAIEMGDVAFLKTMPGIGAKVASQIVLDLKGKLIAVEDGKKNETKYPAAIEEAIQALKNFGYKGGDLQKAANIMSESKDLKVEEYIRIGLRALSK